MITGVMNIGLYVWGSIVIASLLFVIVGLTVRYRIRLKKRKVLLRLLNQDQYQYILVDLRNPRDYETRHIPGALCQPINEIDRFLPTENMFETIFVYGYSWFDSRRAQRILDANGYFNVRSFGSFRNWKGPFESGSTVESTDKDIE